MRRVFFLFIFSVFLMSCTARNDRNNNIIRNDHYDLTRAADQKAVLILFPCFPCDIEHIKAEAGFLKDLEKEGITTLLVDYNQKLFLKESEKKEYANALNSVFDTYKIDKKNIFIGGFSSGGNVAMLLSSYLIKTQNSVQPKGLLVVDSPVDVEQLYHNAEKDIAANANPDAVEEGKFLTALFDKELGKPSENPEKYKEVSPYIISSNSIGNIQYLKGIKTRFYCEPDLEWQNKNRNRTFADLNAFMLKKVNEALLGLGSQKTEYIETRNRGIRANGKRHPHSWNIVEHGELVNWILNNEE